MTLHPLSEGHSGQCFPVLFFKIFTLISMQKLLSCKSIKFLLSLPGRTLRTDSHAFYMLLLLHNWKPLDVVGKTESWQSIFNEKGWIQTVCKQKYVWNRLCYSCPNPGQWLLLLGSPLPPQNSPNSTHPSPFLGSGNSSRQPGFLGLWHSTLRNPWSFSILHQAATATSVYPS